MVASERRLLRRARAQALSFTRAQALEEGVSKSTILRRLRDGAWVALHPGVYALAASPRTWEQRAFAAVLAVGGGAVLSHAAAAYVWGLRDVPPAIIDVTGGARTRRRLDGVRFTRAPCR